MIIKKFTEIIGNEAENLSESKNFISEWSNMVGKLADVKSELKTLIKNSKPPKGQPTRLFKDDISDSVDRCEKIISDMQKLIEKGIL